MKRKLSPWCKEVKKTLIDRDMTVTDLCDQVGMCRNYVSRTINGASYAGLISTVLRHLASEIEEKNPGAKEMREWAETHVEKPELKEIKRIKKPNCK